MSSKESSPAVASSSRSPISIAVYCGSRHGARPAYATSARELGTLIGSRGLQLVYGGGKVGLMGEVADATLAAGGRVVGVIPDSLMRREVGHPNLHELHVVATMHQRKQMMAERAHVFIALPGGIGTLEELYEVWTWRQLGYHDQPIGILNVDGYYDSLLDFMARSVEEGFLGTQQMDMVEVGTEPEELLDRLLRRLPVALGVEDFSRI